MLVTHQFLLVFLFSFLVLFVRIPLIDGDRSNSNGESVITTASSSISTTPNVVLSSYESILPRALDKYGNAIQIQHAQAAADQQGRLIVVVHRKHTLLLQQQQQQPPPSQQEFLEQVWIVTPRPHQNTAAAHLRPKPLHLVQAVTIPSPPPISSSSLLVRDHDIFEDPNKKISNNNNNNTAKQRQSHSMVYLCSTGVQADALWILQQVRSYCIDLVQRYDIYQPQSVAYYIATLQRQFWNYNTKVCYRSSTITSTTTTTTTGSNRDDNDEDENPPKQSTSTWGRPLGVRCLVLTCTDSSSDGYGYGGTTCNTDSNSILMQVIEPSGIVRQINDGIFAMGKHSEQLGQAMNANQQHDNSEHILSWTELDDYSLKRQLVRTLLAMDSSFTSLHLEILSTNGAVTTETITRQE